MKNFHLFTVFGVFLLVSVCLATINENKEDLLTKEDSTSIESSNQEDYQRFKAIGDEKTLKQRETDEDWLKSHRELFIGSGQSKQPEGVVDDLDRLLEKYISTSDSAELKPLKKQLFDLKRLTYMFPNSCDDKTFETYDQLMKK